MQETATYLNNNIFSSLSFVHIVFTGVFLIAMGILSWIRPGGRISFTHSKENRLFMTRIPQNQSEDKEEKVTLSDLCKAATPSTFNLNPFLFNGHLQTAWTTVKNYDIPIYYKRKMFESDNPIYSGRFAVDFVVDPYETPDDDGEAADEARKFTLPSGLPSRTFFFSLDELNALPSNDTKPMLVILHGLSGGSHELYLRHVVEALMSGGGWEACVVNSRGCSQTKISSGVLYNARATWDVRQTVKWLRKTFPNRPLFGIGFSLGANILTNYLGEEGDKCQLKAAVLVANPWNLEMSSRCLTQTWMGMEIYSKTMSSNMKRLFEQHVEEVSKNPRVDVAEVRRAKYLFEFDRSLQCPSWGYPTEGAYYRDASSVDSLLAIRIPFLAVQAEDDPIAHYDAIPFQEFKQTPYGVLLSTSHGGHLGWFEYGGKRWFVNPVTNFLNEFAKAIDLKSPFVVEKPEKVPGQIAHHEDGKDADTAPKPDFNPMRRKLSLEHRQ